ncbi:MAG TPA: NUDIX domain-containing protein [Thermoplasmataceae archaeon]|nr:NUDIX domain-containing protein [Thermoplasmatales archaeon AK]HLH86430.1 NUDIX domain-containing protein [Thermoplasmataceae archaeon]
MRSESQISSGIITFRIVNEQVEYLFLSREEGFLDFPKGHIEAGESPLDAAKRETKEEAGLEPVLIDGFVHEMNYFYTFRGKRISKKVIMYLGESRDFQNAKHSFEHTGIVWLPYEEAIRAIKYGNQREALEHAHSFLREIGIVR